MFKNAKRAAMVIMAAMLATAGLAGCGETNTETSSAVSSAASSSAEVSAADTGDTDDYDYSEGLTENGYFEGVTATELISMPDYKTMEIPEDISTITDDELQSELDTRMSEYMTSEQINTRAVEDGDTVNIDYVGSVDGVEFDGGNTGGAGTTVTIGVTSYIDDFLEQLIGHMPGDTFDVNVTFPDPYKNNTELSGKDAVFVTTINYIVEDITPELTDEFVAENWQELNGWTTVDEAKEAIRKEMRETAISNYIWEQLQTEAEMSELPDSVYQYHLDNMVNYYGLMAEQYGMEVDDFISTYVGVEGVDELIENNADQLKENAKSSLVLQALCEQMEITPTDEDIAKFFVDNAGIEDYSDYENAYGRPYLCLLAREDIAKRALAENR